MNKLFWWLSGAFFCCVFSGWLSVFGLVYGKLPAPWAPWLGWVSVAGAAVFLALAIVVGFWDTRREGAG